MSENVVSTDDAIAVLNRIHATDPEVLPLLIAMRVPCNEALADDPTVQVNMAALFDRPMVHEAGSSTATILPAYEVGLLGIINALFGADEQERGFIAAHYDDEGNLTGFVRTSAS